MASQDGVGWPGEPTKLSLASARDESGLIAEGLGWPRRPDAPKQGPDTREQGQVRDSHAEQREDREDREERPARVRQALAAVSRETDLAGLATQEDVQGSGTLRTRGKSAAAPAVT